MPGNLQSFGESQPLVQQTTFAAGDTTVAKSILSAQTGPYRVDQILLTNNDSGAHNVDLYIRIGSTNTLWGSVGVPAGSGVGGIPPQEVFAQMAITGFSGIALPGADTMQMAMETTIGGSNLVTVTVLGGIF